MGPASPTKEQLTGGYRVPGGFPEFPGFNRRRCCLTYTNTYGAQSKVVFTLNLGGTTLSPFSASTRVVSGVPLNSATNVYSLTYTNSYGAQNQETFTITVGNTPITAWIQVNGAAWQQTSTATVNLGSTVNLGQQQLTGGTYR